MTRDLQQPNEALRHQRLLRGWSQGRVAQEIGTSAEVVNRWESGKKQTGPYYQEKLCALFGKNAEELGFLRPVAEDLSPGVAAQQSGDTEPASKQDHETPDDCSLRTPASLSASQLGLKVEPTEDLSIMQLSEQQETIPQLAQAISQGIIMAIQELGSQDMDTSRRKAIAQLLGTVTALVGADKASPAFVTHPLRGHNHLFSFEQELAIQWNLYHTGGTVQAYHGLHTFFSGLKDFTDKAKGSLLHGRALTSLCLGYQLEGSLYRDMMKYDDAHTSYTQAFEVAKELDDSELKAAALARRGVTYIQQNQPGEAIEYLQEAYMLIEKIDLPFLVGYIFQALSEAYAIAQQSSESERNIELAQQSLEQRGKVPERSYCQANTTSVTAQKGVNAVHLHDYTSAMTLLEQGLANYNPSLVRGRARLKAQKAEADYGLGLIDACCQDATEAWILARSAGSNKTFTRLRNLQRALVLSPWKKEQRVIDLNWVMATL